MARIAGVNLPKEKRVEAALLAIYGIGRSTATKLIEQAKIDKNLKVHQMSEDEANALRVLIDKMMTEGDLKRKIAMDIKRLKEIGSYRGFRHTKGLPVRGQRTQANARTRKGKKKTVANKKQVGK